MRRLPLVLLLLLLSGASGVLAEEPSEKEAPKPLTPEQAADEAFPLQSLL